MISGSEVVGFVPTTDAGKARAFYEDVLELAFVSENPFALVFASGPTAIRVVKMDTFTPAPYTVLGWMVKDIEAEARALTARGVRFLRYPPMEQSELGIWTAPDGSRVAWFRDPSENVLSLAQHSRPGER